MDKESRIYIAGHTGLVGSAIIRSLRRKSYSNIIYRTYEKLDLRNQEATEDFFRKEQPEYVFLAAAMVGGIIANNTYRADFIYNNIMIQSNVIHACWKFGVKKLLFLGSTCIYPKNAPQPLKEEYLLTSALEYTNEPYAIAKISGLKMCEAFNTQYGTNFIAVMPTNLFGPGDNYNLEKSHVLPALLRKIHLGKCLENNDWKRIRKDFNRYPLEETDGKADDDRILEKLNKYGIFSDGNGSVRVTVWGTGSPLREFMHSDDMADACVYLMGNINIADIVELNKKEGKSEYHSPHFLNIGTGKEISIKELAMNIKAMTGFKGNVVFDKTKPDGTFRKTLDISILHKLGFKHRYNLNIGLAEYHSAYLNNL